MTLPAGTGYGYNTVSHRYYSITSGQFVSRETVAEGLQSMMDVSALRMNALTQNLIDNKITLANWQTGMMTEIKNTNVASAALANGGWANMTQSDWGATGQLIREQYDYLRNYAKEIADGTQALDGRALVRSDLYADAANGTFWEMDKRSMIADGYDMARRVLEVKDDGNCDGCLEAAAEGWLPIDDVLPIGDAECMTRCRCSIEYRKSGDE
jgi:hypothetical protein